MAARRDRLRASPVEVRQQLYRGRYTRPKSKHAHRTCRSATPWPSSLSTQAGERSRHKTIPSAPDRGSAGPPAQRPVRPAPNPQPRIRKGRGSVAGSTRFGTRRRRSYSTASQSRGDLSLRRHSSPQITLRVCLHMIRDTPPAPADLGVELALEAKRGNKWTRTRGRPGKFSPPLPPYRSLNEAGFVSLRKHQETA